MRHGVCAHLLTALAAAAVSLALPAAALASGGSPLHIDPSSPVAKEYALPLATARGAPPESGQTGALFGAGITAPAKHASASGAASSAVASGTAATGAASGDATTGAASGDSPTGAASGERPKAGGPSSGAAGSGASSAGAESSPAALSGSAGATAGSRRSVRRDRLRASLAAARLLHPGSSLGLVWMLAAGLLVVALGSAGGIALARAR